MSTKKITIDISHRTIFFILFLFLLVVFFRQITGILLGLFIAVLVAVAINPLVNFLAKRKVPRSLSALMILVLFLVLLTILVVSIISPLISQTQNFIQQLPELVSRLAPYNIDLSAFGGQLSQAPRSVLRIALNTFSGIIFFFTIIVICFYILQDLPNLKKYLSYLFGDKRAETYYQITSELESKLGSWVRGEILLMLIVGLLNYLGFVLIGLPYAIPLAVIAGIFELVPNIGPTVAAIPAIIVGFTVSPTHGLMTLGLAILVQQLENHIIVPKVMQRAIGLHPVITIVSLLIGFSLGGPLLAILSLPIIVSTRVILSHLRSRGMDNIEIS